MLKAIVIDDELKARKTLVGLLQNFTEGVEVVAEADNVATGVEAIVKQDPDVVFLDIKLSSETGFDLLNSLPKIDFELIFVTAHGEYALKAIQFSALDYLLKPLNIEDLIAAVQKLKERKENQKKSERIQLYQENLHHRFSRVALPTQEEVFICELSEIIRCEGDNVYTTFHLTNGKKILVSKTLKKYENLFTEYGFFRVLKSHLVNLIHVKKYIRGRGGEIVLTDGEIISVSRDRKKELLDRLQHLS